MSYKEAREHVRTRIITLAEYNKAYNKANRFHRKLEHNRPKVDQAPVFPDQIKKDEDPYFSLTVYHMVYNKLKGKPNSHVIKYDEWAKEYAERKAVELFEWLQEKFEFQLEQDRAAV